MNGVEAFPLHWPQHQARTISPDHSRFGKTPSVCQDELFHELKLLGATSVTLSSDIQLRQDGLPYTNRRRPDDSGVAVYFMYQDKAMCFACDKWLDVHENTYAIAKTIGAIRGISRWGSTNMLNQAFAGFEAIPSTLDSDIRSWWTVLGVSRDAPTAIVVDSYQKKRRKAHPDKIGGSHERFTEIQAAYDEFLLERDL